MAIPKSIVINDRFIIKIDKYIRLINDKYKLEKQGLSTDEINNGELEIVDDEEIEESDPDSHVSDDDLLENDDFIDPEKNKLRLRDKYMLENYQKESNKVSLSKEDLLEIKK